MKNVKKMSVKKANIGVHVYCTIKEHCNHLVFGKGDHCKPSQENNQGKNGQDGDKNIKQNIIVSYYAKTL